MLDRFRIIVVAPLEFRMAASIANAILFRQFEVVIIDLTTILAAEAARNPLDQMVIRDDNDEEQIFSFYIGTVF